MADAPNPPARRRIRPVSAAAPTRPEVRPVALPPVPVEDDRYVGPSPAELAQMPIRQRIEILEQFHPEAAEQLALDTVHQYMMARTPTDVIAQRMGYSHGWVVKQRQKLQRKFKEQVEQLDVKSYTMQMLDQLQEISAMGMREAAAAKPAEYGRRLAGINSARVAIQDQAKLLHLAGAFETAPLRPHLAPQDEQDKASGLKELSRNFLNLVYQAKGIRPGDTIIDNGVV